MGTPDLRLQAFMATYKVDADEIWPIKSGTYAIKHSALERVAAEQKITFDLPHFAEKDAMQNNVALLVVGHMGDRTEWSIGEASPANYRITGKQPGYPYAMAEKRAKDRVILKLLNSSHGLIYSEDELDGDQPKRANPHVTRPEDILPATEYDEHGEIIDNIPHGDPSIDRMPKAKAREDFAKCQAEIRATATIAQLEKWAAANKDRVATFPVDWAEMIRGVYSEHRNDLRASLKAAQ